MQSISLKDDVTLEETECAGIRVTSNFHFLPVTAAILPPKAANQFFERTGLSPRNLAIHIHKKFLYVPAWQAEAAMVPRYCGFWVAYGETGCPRNDWRILLLEWAVMYPIASGEVPLWRKAGENG